MKGSKMTDILSEKSLLFSVGLDTLEDRLDPLYYQPEYVYLIDGLKKCPYEIKTIDEIADVENFGAYALYNEIKYVDEGGIPFLRVVDISEDYINVGNAVRISEETHDLLVKSKVKPNTVLLSMTGTVGIAVVAPEDIGECNSNQHIAKITLEENVKEEVNPWYISAFLNSKLGQLQIQRISTGSTHSHIFLYSIKSFKIPIPPRLIQDKIANIMQDAYEEKKESLQKADELLNSIDDLILDELGIEIPEVKAKWYYSVKKGDIEDRLDAEFYKPDYVTLLEALKRSKYEFSNMKVISKSITRGTEVGSGEYKEDGFPFLRVQNIQKYEINFDDCVFISEETYNNLKRYKIEPNDVLFTKDGTIGLSTLVPEGIQDCITSSGISRIKLNENVNPNYVVAVLNTDFIRLQAERISYGSIIIHFSLTELEKLKIPLPPLKIQNKIANEVKNRREEIENPRIRAETVIGEAKKRVERMILGKNGGAT